MSPDDALDPKHTENAGPLAYLQARHPGAEQWESAATADTWDLSAHPDLTSHFWTAAKNCLPADCRLVIYNAPALVHPESGVIFAFAGGTSTVMLRMPPAVCALAFEVPRYGRAYDYPSETIRASDVGPDWALAKPFDEPRIESWLQKAYAYVGDM